MSDANTQSTETETKRTRTSPRTKALDEVIAMLDANLADLAKQDQDDLTVQSKVEAVSDIKNRVVGLLEAGAEKPTYAGRHYIGVSADGARVGFDSNVPPTRRSHGPESKHAFTSVLGPFRTEEGVSYRIEHPETECAIVF